jgi:exosortase D (VPLPA-CTERM-specific)
MTNYFTKAVPIDSSQKAIPLGSRLSTSVLVIACVALACTSARDGLGNLYERWMYEEEYGYGFLILAIAPLLLWRRWPRIAASNGSAWPGLLIVILGQLITVIAVMGESYLLEQVSLIVTLLGIAGVVFGSGALRLFLPIAFLLLLTLPLPYTLQSVLTIKLQLLSTRLGVGLIQLFGVPVYVEGNVIDLGTYKLQVAEACSGLRYLLPLTCISFVLAYLYEGPLWKRAIVVASATPLTIFINSFRIAVTAILVGNFGTQMAEGFLHQFEGWIIFLIGALLIGLVVFALEKFNWAAVRFEPLFEWPTSASPKAGGIKTSLSLVLVFLVCAGTLGLTSSIAAAYRGMSAPVRSSFAEFPRQLEDWGGRPEQLEPEVRERLKATDYYIGDFVTTAGAVPVNLFVAYYGSMNKSAGIHSPRSCLPGSGWEFASFAEESFDKLVSGATGSYNQVVLQKGEQKLLMYYWFQQRQRRTANEFGLKYYLLLDGFSTSRKDGGLVRLYTPIVGENGEAAASARLRAFARTLLPQLQAYMPERE